MFIPFLLFGMFIAATGTPTNLSLNAHNTEYGLRDLCEFQCHTKCQGKVQKRCLRCYHKCWLLKSYSLDSGSYLLVACRNKCLTLPAYSITYNRDTLFGGSAWLL